MKRSKNDVRAKEISRVVTWEGPKKKTPASTTPYDERSISPLSFLENRTNIDMGREDAKSEVHHSADIEEDTSEVPLVGVDEEKAAASVGATDQESNHIPGSFVEKQEEELEDICIYDVKIEIFVTKK